MVTGTGKGSLPLFKPANLAPPGQIGLPRQVKLRQHRLIEHHARNGGLSGFPASVASTSYRRTSGRRTPGG